MFYCLLFVLGCSAFFAYTQGIDSLNDDYKFAQDSLEKTHGKIIFSSVLFRHGDRTPHVLFPTLNYTASSWPEGVGQLNKKGKLRIYKLGKWFRERYIDLRISDGYRYDLLTMNSSDMDRTIMSAELFLAGFLPPTGKEVWSDDDLKWQPIPVHNKPLDQDEVLGGRAPCERYTLENYKANESPEWKKVYYDNEALFKYVLDNAGVPLRDGNNYLEILDDVAQINDCLQVLDAYSMSLPPWANNVYPERLQFISPLYMYSRVSSPEQQRLIGGPFLKSLISDMQKKKNFDMKQSFHFYAGHDTTIVAVLNMMKFFDFVPPSYGSSLIIELREIEGQHLVTVLYRNNTEIPPYVVNIRHCGEYCTLNKFIEIFSPMIPENWIEECQVGFFEAFYVYNKLIVMLMLCSVLLFLFGVLVFGILMCIRGGGRLVPYDNI